MRGKIFACGPFGEKNQSVWWERRSFECCIGLPFRVRPSVHLTSYTRLQIGTDHMPTGYLSPPECASEIYLLRVLNDPLLPFPPALNALWTNGGITISDIMSRKSAQLRSYAVGKEKSDGPTNPCELRVQSGFLDHQMEGHCRGKLFGVLALKGLRLHGSFDCGRKAGDIEAGEAADTTEDVPAPAAPVSPPRFPFRISQNNEN
ncbi:hypothetical protein EDB89DRAFT_2240888 [Lactarius sanguifluus]|nr:hypothetical protein EDB89DRAFT_2240888 [Lactarius sanguifluus]